MTLTDDAKAVVALTTRLGTPGRPSLTARAWDRFASALRDAGLRPRDVFAHGFDPRRLPGIDGETADRVADLLRDVASATLAADELRDRGIWTLTIEDQSYPARLRLRLGLQAPPVLFGVGDRALLAGASLGIVGSREIEEETAAVATALATEAASRALTVVSGGARGTDRLAMNAAHQAGGTVVGVLGDSLLSRIRRPETLAALDEGQVCLVTQQAPSAGFTPAAAMGRNKIIYALADLTVVVASDLESGGTWAGATEALRHRYGAVAVWRGEGAGSGNAALETLGALPLKDVSDLAHLLETSERHWEQMSLQLDNP